MNGARRIRRSGELGGPVIVRLSLMKSFAVVMLRCCCATAAESIVAPPDFRYG